MIELDESCNGREFVLAPGEEIRLKLAENPTTGYRWGFSVEELHPLRLDEDVFEPMGEAMGAVSHRRWRFRADGEGVVQVRLEQRRSWERTAVKTFHFTIRVRKPA